MNFKENLKKGAYIAAELALPIGTTLQLYKDAIKTSEIKDRKSKCLYYASRFGIVAKDFVESALIGYSLGGGSSFDTLLSMGTDSFVQVFTMHHAVSKGQSKINNQLKLKDI
jgi:hypothetical protein